MILSAHCALIITTVLAYVNLTTDLPSVETLPILFNPPEGLLLQPTRIYDRTGKQIFTRLPRLWVSHHAATFHSVLPIPNIFPNH